MVSSEVVCRTSTANSAPEGPPYRLFFELFGPRGRCAINATKLLQPILYDTKVLFMRERSERKPYAETI